MDDDMNFLAQHQDIPATSSSHTPRMRAQADTSYLEIISAQISSQSARMDKLEAEVHSIHKDVKAIKSMLETLTLMQGSGGCTRYGK